MSVESRLHWLEAPGQFLPVPTDCNESVAAPRLLQKSAKSLHSHDAILLRAQRID